MIRIGIAGYGNLGRGVESALSHTEDMELVGVFTRRSPDSVKTKTGVPVYSMEQAKNMTDKIDIMILCGGSANDLPKQTAELAQYFNVIDSFDTHAKIPEHFADVDAACKKSDAIRRIPGVQDARQYTIPVESALESVRRGENPELTTREKHTRECFVVAKEGADKAAIEEAIVTMPNYFSDYDTTVHFISQEELDRDHSGIPHGGMVFRTGVTGLNGENKHVIEYKLTLDSNPEFTSSVLVAFARAAYRMHSEGQVGCKTVFDVAPAYLHLESGEALRAKLL